MTSEQLQRLHLLKEKSKLTNKAVAEAVGVTESTVSRILSGESKDPSFDVVVSIIKAFNGSVEEVLGISKKGEDDMQALIAIREIYENQIKSLNKDKLFLAVVAGFLIVFIVGILILDFTHGSIGWFRY